MKREECAQAQDVEPVREAFRFDEQRLAQWRMSTTTQARCG